MAGADLRFAFLEQFNERGVAGVAETALVPLDDPRVAARTVRIARRDFGEQLGDHLLVVEPRYCQAPGVQGVLLGQRDQLFDERADFLRLGDGRDDPVMREQRPGQIAHKRVAMAGAAVKGAAGFEVSHGGFPFGAVDPPDATSGLGSII